MSVKTVRRNLEAQVKLLNGVINDRSRKTATALIAVDARHHVLQAITLLQGVK